MINELNNNCNQKMDIKDTPIDKQNLNRNVDANVVCFLLPLNHNKDFNLYMRQLCQAK